jgi:hypothetical protein
MARRRINSDEAIEIFEDGWTKFEPRLTSPFLIELDVREIFGGQGRRQGQMDIPEFIDGWMSWRALRSVGYVVRDASKALQAACHARGALLYGTTSCAPSTSRSGPCHAYSTTSTTVWGCCCHSLHGTA